MAPPPPAKCPTTVLDLNDFLLREVFLRLPALPSLVRAALACRTFLSAVRSSPAFRRSFHALHPSPFVGFFIQRFIGGFKPEDSSFEAHHLPTDRDFAAAVRGGDFDLTGLPYPDEDEDSDEEDENSEEEEDEENNMEKDTDEEDENSEEEDYEENKMEEDTDGQDENSEEDDEESNMEEDTDGEDENSEEEDDDEAASSVWQIERCCDGYVVLFNQKAKKIAAYNPLTQALHLFPSPPHLFTDAINIEFHIVSSQENPGAPPSVVVCFYTDFDQAVVGIISSDRSIESKWQKFPETAIGLTGKMVNGSVYWTHVGKPYMTVLDTATLQFTKMDLPPLLAERQDDRECTFVLGDTKDGRPCIVSPALSGDCSLNVYFWRRDEYIDDGLSYWILDQTFPLNTIRQFIQFSEGDDEFVILRLMQLIDGVVYLRTAYDGYTEAPPLLLSFCLETAELKMICQDYHKPIHPYIMAWPPSLVLDKGPCSKGQALSTPGSEGSDGKARGG